MKYRIFLFFALLSLFFVPMTEGANSGFPVIVKVAPGTNINALVTAAGGQILDSIEGADTYLVQLPSITATSAVPAGIEWIEPNWAVSLDPIVLNGVLKLSGNGAADWYRQQPAWKIIRANEASAQSSGRGVIVADINSAVDTSHPALAGHLIDGYDFVGSKRGEAIAMDQSSASFMDQSSASFMDQSSASFIDQSSASFIDQSSASFMDATHAAYGHGTLCAGIIAAIAPKAMIMPIRVFDEKGEADLFTIAKAVRYAVGNGAEVINMSFGTLAPSNALKGAIEFASQSGVTLVASAGNRNTSDPQYPAAYRDVIAVAATDLHDVKASFSNYGKSVFTDAPGVQIISSYPRGTYAVSSGTSFSAPTIAGTAALVRGEKAARIAESIARGSVNIDGKNPNYAHQLGYGRIDILSAVRSR